MSTRFIDKPIAFAADGVPVGRRRHVRAVGVALAWEGAVSRTHIHVWAAIVVGGIISLFPALLGVFRPGRKRPHASRLPSPRC